MSGKTFVHKPDQWSPSVHNTLQSLIPSMIHKCFWLKTNMDDAQCNIQLTQENVHKRYPENWWKSKFIYGIHKHLEPHGL